MQLHLQPSPSGLAKTFFALQTARDVAGLLEIDYPTLTYHIYRTKEDERYWEFEVPKRSGGVTTIRSPATTLRILQSKLNEVLNAVYRPKASTHGSCEVEASSPTLGNTVEDDGSLISIWKASFRMSILAEYAVSSWQSHTKGILVWRPFSLSCVALRMNSRRELQHRR